MINKMVQKIEQKCGRCNAKIIATDSELVCSKCGVVMAERFSDDTFDYDYIVYDGSGKRGGRTGPPENKMMIQSSHIGQSGKDSYGNYLKGETKEMVRRISLWDQRQKSMGHRTQTMANSEITRLCQVLHINESIKQRGAEIFRECEEYKMMRGRTTTVFAAACLYTACRENGINKTLTDFTKVCYARRSDISAYFRLILQTLNIKTAIMSPINYISSISSKTIPPINVGTQKKAIKLLNTLEGKEGKDPIGLAAAVLYYCCAQKGWDYTQRVIALAAGITEVTIRNRMKDILKQVEKDEI
jgi:transcription initiation factor TFIIB